MSSADSPNPSHVGFILGNKTLRELCSDLLRSQLTPSNHSDPNRPPNALITQEHETSSPAFETEATRWRITCGGASALCVIQRNGQPFLCAVKATPSLVHKVTRPTLQSMVQKLGKMPYAGKSVLEITKLDAQDWSKRSVNRARHSFSFTPDSSGGRVASKTLSPHEIHGADLDFKPVKLSATLHNETFFQDLEFQLEVKLEFLPPGFYGFVMKLPEASTAKFQELFVEFATIRDSLVEEEIFHDAFAQSGLAATSLEADPERTTTESNRKRSSDSHTHYRAESWTIWERWEESSLSVLRAGKVRAHYGWN